MSTTTETRGGAVFDRDVLLNYVAGDRASMLDIMRMVLEEAPRWLEQAREAVQSQRPERIFVAGHTMAGSLSTIGAREAASVAIRLERMGKSADLTGASETVRELEQAMDDLTRSLQAEIAASAEREP